MKRVIVYSSSSCSHCISAKDFLKNKGIKFEERNISTSAVYKKQLMKLKSLSVPTILIGDEVIIGFDRNKIQNALK